MPLILHYLEENIGKMKATSLVDLGCGEGALETELAKKKLLKSVFSYDLVSTKEHVK